MIEKDYSIHLRARDDFFKSLLLSDEFGDEAIHYLESLQNLKHKGFILQKNFFDDVCYSQASILKDMFHPSSFFKYPKFNIEDTFTSNWEAENRLTDETRGSQEHKTLSSRATLMDNVNHIWSDSMVDQNDEISEFAARWPESRFDGGTRYKHHPHHKDIHPLRRKNSKTGRSNMIEELRGYYLPSDGGLNRAALDDERDSKIEEYYKEHKTIRGVIKPITKEKFSPFLNSLKTTAAGTGTKEHAGTFQNSLYERAYNRWRQSPKAEEAIKSGINDRQLREQHFEDAADLWENDDYQETQKMVEKDIEGYDDYKESLEVSTKHPHRLGWLGHKLGLEWLEPKERSEVVEHLMKNGAHKVDGQIKLSTGLTIPLGRVIRNMMTRGDQEYKHSQGEHSRGLPNLPHQQNIDDIQEDEKPFTDGKMRTVLSSTRVNNKKKQKLTDFMLDYYNDLIDWNQGDTFERRSTSKGINQVPIFNEDDTKNIKDMMNELMSDEQGDKKMNEREALKYALMYHKKYDSGSTKTNLKPNVTLEDIKKYTSLTEEHPLSNILRVSKENPIFPLDEDDDKSLEPSTGNFYKTLENKAVELQTVAEDSKDINNVLSIYRNTHGPDINSLNDKERQHYESKDGRLLGRGSYWGHHFQNGSSPMSNGTWWDKISSMLPGFFGEMTESGFIPRSDMHSLIGNMVKDIKDPHQESPATLGQLMGHHDASSPISRKTSRERKTRSRARNKHNGESAAHTFAPDINRALIDNPDANFSGNLHVASGELDAHPLHHNWGTMTGAEGGVVDTHLAHNSSNLFRDYIFGGHFIKPGDKDPETGRVLTGSPKMRLSINDILSGKYDESMPSYQLQEQFDDVFQENQDRNNKTSDLNDNKEFLLTGNVKQKDNQNLLTSLNNKNQDSLQLLQENAYDMMSTIKDFEESKSPDGSFGDSRYWSLKQIESYDAFMASDEGRKMLEDFGNNNIHLNDYKGATEKDIKNHYITMIKDNMTKQLEQMKEDHTDITNKLNENLSFENQRSLDKTGIRGNSKLQDMEEMKMANEKARMKIAKTKIMPEMLKIDPEAFNPNDPTKCAINMSQVMHDAELYLMHVPQSEHGRWSSNYILGEPETKSATIIGDNENSEHSFATQSKHLRENGVEISPNDTEEEALIKLNLPNDGLHRNYIKGILSSMGGSRRFMSMGQISSLHRNSPFNYGKIAEDPHHAHDAIDDLALDSKRLITEERQQGNAVNNKKHIREFNSTNPIYKFFNMIQREYKMGGEVELGNHGLTHHPLKRGFYGEETGKNKSGNRAYNENIAKRQATELISFDEGKFNEGDIETVEQTPIGRGRSEIHPNIAGKGTPINAHYTSPGFRLHHGVEMGAPSASMNINFNGDITWGDKTISSPSIMPSEVVQQGLLGAESWQNFQQNATTQGFNFGNTVSNSERATPEEPISELNLNVQTMTKADLPKEMPLIEPYHKIFEVEDLEQLRGFTGEWVASILEEGERIKITRKSSFLDVKNTENEKVGLSDDEKISLRKLGKKNYVMDAIKNERGIHIFDIMHYDDNDVTDMDTRERIKLLRGQFDSHERVMIPGPSNLKIIDEEGLEEAVKNLNLDNKEGKILLRDAKSTYMKGEEKHPKWVLLTKSDDEFHVPFGMELEDNNFIIHFDHDVIKYDIVENQAENPRSALGELNQRDYTLLLAKSLELYWKPSLDAMLKEQKKMHESESEDESEDESEEKLIEEESAGIIDHDDPNLISKPDYKKAIDVLERVLDAIEKGHFPMTAGKGLGIDVGSDIASPRGPTKLTHESTLPDWDMKERSTQDPEKPEDYPKKKKIPSQSIES